MDQINGSPPQVYAAFDRPVIALSGAMGVIAASYALGLTIGRFPSCGPAAILLAVAWGGAETRASSGFAALAYCCAYFFGGTAARILMPSGAVDLVGVFIHLGTAATLALLVASLWLPKSASPFRRHSHGFVLALLLANPSLVELTSGASPIAIARTWVQGLGLLGLLSTLAIWSALWGYSASDNKNSFAGSAVIAAALVVAVAFIGEDAKLFRSAF